MQERGLRVRMREGGERENNVRERGRENIILLNGKYENKEKTPKMFLF